MLGMEKKETSTKWKEWRRRRGCELREAGWTIGEISEALGVSKVAVSQWMKRVDRFGVGGLSARPRSGRPRKLSSEQYRLIPDCLSHGAEAYGFRGEVWTSKRVAEVIRTEFGVTYHPAHVTRLLKALNWTPQKPVDRARQRNEAEIEWWREKKWPALKKKPVGKDGRL